MLDILGDQLYLQSDNNFTFYSKSDTCEKIIRQNFNNIQEKKFLESKMQEFP